jgi:hypothetical protein
MIIQLTENQRAIIEEATQTKYNDVRELEALKRLGPPIRENIIKGMLKRGLLEIRTDEDGGKLTLVSDMGYAAIGKAANEEPPAASKASKTPDAPKHSKQQIMIDLLKREEGATLHQLSAATGWQKHSVHGAMAGVLKKKLGLTIASDKNRDGERIYRIA